MQDEMRTQLQIRYDHARTNFLTVVTRLGRVGTFEERAEFQKVLDTYCRASDELRSYDMDKVDEVRRHRR